MSPYQPYAGIYGVSNVGCPTYGSLSLTATSPAQSPSEPLTVGELHEALKLPDRDDDEQAREDFYLGSLISAAREVAEIEQGRDLVRKQWDLSFDYFYSYGIELRDPLVSVDLFQYRDSSGTQNPMVEGTNFVTDTARHPGIITPVFNTRWPSFQPWPSSAVLIRFTSGYLPTNQFWAMDAGRRLKHAMTLLISGWYNNKLPYAIARSIQEYPYGVTQLLQLGGIKSVR